MQEELEEIRMFEYKKNVQLPTLDIVC